jgi:hypothetical protein
LLAIHAYEIEPQFASVFKTVQMYNYLKNATSSSYIHSKIEEVLIKQPPLKSNQEL